MEIFNFIPAIDEFIDSLIINDEKEKEEIRSELESVFYKKITRRRITGEKNHANVDSNHD